MFATLDALQEANLVFQWEANQIPRKEANKMLLYNIVLIKCVYVQ